jgi:hypothetical protein
LNIDGSYRGKNSNFAAQEWITGQFRRSPAGARMISMANNTAHHFKRPYSNLPPKTPILTGLTGRVAEIMG